MRIYRPSQILKYEDCPRAYWYQYVEKIRSEKTAANLIFGTAVHAGINTFFSGKGDPVAVFEKTWKDETSNAMVEYSSIWTPEEMQATGKRLVELFPAAWKKTGLVPLIDEHGPVIERRFKHMITHEVGMSGQPDLFAMNSEGGAIPLDFKTPASSVFGWQADQLTAYQKLLESHKEQLGVEHVAGVAFMDLLKKKIPKTGKGTGPEIIEPEILPARTEDELTEYEQKVIWVDEDIRKGRFPRRGRMAYNTPCTLCDYSGLCLKGDWEGLVKPDKKQAALI